MHAVFQIVNILLPCTLGQECALCDGSLRRELQPPLNWPSEDQTVDFIFRVPPMIAEDLLFFCHNTTTRVWANFWNGSSFIKPKVYLWGLLKPSFCAQLLHSHSENTSHPLLADHAAARCVGVSLLATPGPRRNGQPPKLPTYFPKHMSINMCCQPGRLFHWSWMLFHSLCTDWKLIHKSRFSSYTSTSLLPQWE